MQLFARLSRCLGARDAGDSRVLHEDKLHRQSNAPAAAIGYSCRRHGTIVMDAGSSPAKHITLVILVDRAVTTI